jgi:predicted kinase
LIQHETVNPERTTRRQILPKTCLILMMGVAGSGKSTLAKELLRHVWAVYLDNNHIVDAFFSLTRRGPTYEKWRPQFYQALYTIVGENLAIGNSVILDVPHVKEMQDRQWRNAIKALAKRTKSKLVIIRCYCADSNLRSRLQSRGEPRDRWKLNHWQEFLVEQPIQGVVPFTHLEVDMDDGLSANVQAVMGYIFKQARAALK